MRAVHKLFFALTLLLSVTACVTTTQGGFNTEPSLQQAEQDFVQLAIGYYEAGDMTAARRNINNALDINSRSSAAYNALALVLQSEGDDELAKRTFERAISYDANNSRARNNFAAFLFELGEFEQSYQQLERVANDTTYEGRAIAFQNLGLTALQTERPERALYAFERAVQLDSNLYRSSLELAQLHYDSGNFTEARRRYQQFLTTSNFYSIPQTPRSLWLGVQIERRFDNEPTAAIYAAILQRLFSDSPQYQEYLKSLK
ncbi:MAG: type IV pilus biogenesis/stability protein PilW [Pseudohongiellaceae bacterium]|nr:type IV pilus biogenesis/stability protein PilW [Pseudohongiellaceae bacterium]